ncbi:hypothetical protein RYX36_033278 [Vicia faba]
MAPFEKKKVTLVTIDKETLFHLPYALSHLSIRFSIKFGCWNEMYLHKLFFVLKLQDVANAHILENDYATANIRYCLVERVIHFSGLKLAGNKYGNAPFHLNVYDLINCGTQVGFHKWHCNQDFWLHQGMMQKWIWAEKVIPTDFYQPTEKLHKRFTLNSNKTLGIQVLESRRFFTDAYYIPGGSHSSQSNIFLDDANETIIFSSISSLTKYTCFETLTISIFQRMPRKRRAKVKEKKVLPQEKKDEQETFDVALIKAIESVKASKFMCFFCATLVVKNRGWYQMDDVEAEWKNVKNETCLHVHCFVSGPNSFLDQGDEFRYHIFSKERPLI